jgi:hypothetical protein
MHQKLRHQLNIHKISGSYKPKYLYILLTSPLFFLLKTNMLSEERIELTSHVR